MFMLPSKERLRLVWVCGAYNFPDVVESEHSKPDYNLCRIGFEDLIVEGRIGPFDPVIHLGIMAATYGAVEEVNFGSKTYERLKDIDKQTFALSFTINKQRGFEGLEGVYIAVAEPILIIDGLDVVPPEVPIVIKGRSWRELNRDEVASRLEKSLGNEATNIILEYLTKPAFTGAHLCGDPELSAVTFVLKLKLVFKVTPEMFAKVASQIVKKPKKNADPVAQLRGWIRKPRIEEDWKLLLLLRHASKIYTERNIDELCRMRA